MVTTVVSPFKFAGGSAPTAKINGSAETDQGTPVATPLESLHISGAEADTKSSSTHTRLGQFARTGALVGLALAGMGAVEGLAPTLAAADDPGTSTTVCQFDTFTDPYFLPCKNVGDHLLVIATPGATHYKLGRTDDVITHDGIIHYDFDQMGQVINRSVVSVSPKAS